MLCFLSCSQKNDYLIRVPQAEAYHAEDPYAYVNSKGDTIVPKDKYSFFYTDTIFDIGFVAKQGVGWIAINTQGEELFQVFNFDNGPDYVSEGVFRIVENGKIGFADEKGKIIISPQYPCAFPFEKGKAKVSLECHEIKEGEHSFWKSDHWFYIDHSNNKVKSE